MIKFKLNNIIREYNAKHPKNKLTITSLARDTGVSRHSLQKLCGGKYQQSKGIAFDTLNRLIDFFRCPVTDFIKYVPDGMHIELDNANDIVNPSKISAKLRTNLKYSIIVTIDYQDGSKSNKMLLRPVQNDGHKDLFIFEYMELGEPTHKFSDIFNNLDKMLQRYIYTRAIAHSGLLSRKSVDDDEPLLSILYTLDNGRDISPKLKRKFILHPGSAVFNVPKNTVINDGTSNQFKYK